MEPKELESLLHKVGGKFKLVTLFQKRMRERQRNMPMLVAMPENSSIWDVVTAEIMESKVDLIMGDEAELMRKEIVAREAEEAAAEESKGKKLEAPKAAAKAAAAAAAAEGEAKA